MELWNLIIKNVPVDLWNDRRCFLFLSMLFSRFYWTDVFAFSRQRFYSSIVFDRVLELFETVKKTEEFHSILSFSIPFKTKVVPKKPYWQKDILLSMFLVKSNRKKSSNWIIAITCQMVAIVFFLSHEFLLSMWENEIFDFWERWRLSIDRREEKKPAAETERRHWNSC